MPATARLEKHHWVPRLKGGKETGLLHRICHRKIHATFSEAELATHYNSPETLLQSPDIASFVRWIRKKPPEFEARTFEAANKRKKRCR